MRPQKSTRGRRVFRESFRSLHQYNQCRTFTKSGLDFVFFSPKFIRSVSVVSVNNDQYSDIFNRPTDGGVYDLAMGPSATDDDLCKTCGETSHFCSGHLGHIELPVPVLNPVLSDAILKVLRATCFVCHRFKYTDLSRLIVVSKHRLITAGLLTDAGGIGERIMGFLSKRDLAGDDTMSVISADNDEQYKDQSLHNLVDIPDEVRAKVEDVLGGLLDRKRSNSLTKTVVWALGELERECLGSTRVRDTCPKCETKKTLITYRGGRFLVDRRKGASSVALKEMIVSNVIGFNVDAEMTAENELDSSGGSLKEERSVADVKQNYLLPKSIQDHFRALWANDREIFRIACPFLQKAETMDWDCPTDAFLIHALPVPPPRVRPMAKMGDRVVDHPLSFNLNGVVSAVLSLQRVKKEYTSTATPTKALSEAMNNSLFELQNSVNRLVDTNLYVGQSSRTALGLKQLISGKEGIIRSNVMGKRVNYAARTVITPDPMISVEEIGIPQAIAVQMSVPENVTVWNEPKLQQQVLNGPHDHPGALTIEMEDGKHKLVADQLDRRIFTANTLLSPPGMYQEVIHHQKIVHRHLQDGDMVIMNRQPTLHRPSMIAHRVRILPQGKTFSLHYANCSGYNADFDGDEMNCHIPQSLQARAEARFIVNVANNYLVPKNGAPLQGLIQDHVVSGVLLTIRGRFLNKADYLQLVYSALWNHKGAIKILPPTILKPQVLWSGKQVISTILINLTPKDKTPITLCAKAKVPEGEWCQGKTRAWKAGGTTFSNPCDCMGESEVRIRQGELIQGILDKCAFGSQPFGLLHCSYELFGGSVSCALLSAFSRMLTFHLQQYGFTVGYSDILCTDKANKKRKKIAKETRKIGRELAKKATGTSTEGIDDDEESLRLKLETLHRGRDEGAGMKRLDSAYKSGLDGQTNKVNTACMSGGLLVPFPKNFMQLMVISGAKGSKVNSMQMSSLLGQVELEGRRPPLMISGKCLPSFLPYETSPSAGGYIAGRYITGVGPRDVFFHCQAGREGLIDTAVKTSRSGYLQRSLIKLLEGVTVAYDSTVRDSDGSVIQFQYGEDGLDISKMPFLSKRNLPFLEENWKNLYNKQEVKKLKEIIEQKEDMGSGSTRVEIPLFKDIPTPISKMLDTYMKERKPESSLKTKLVSSKKFRQLIQLKALKCKVVPGEAVGLLAAQSIGEPSTQMTLNTFHFAGRADMNVTMGIPRLREILMTATQNPKTPSMEIPALPGVSRKALNRLQRSFNRVKLADVLSQVHITEKEETNSRIYTLRFEFISDTGSFGLSTGQILQYMESRFLQYGLFSSMKKLWKVVGSEGSKIEEEKLQQRASVIGGGRGNGFDDENGVGAEDEGAGMKKNNKTGGFGEGADEDDDDEDVGNDNDEGTDVGNNRRKRNDEADYDGEEEEQAELGYLDEDDGIWLEEGEERKDAMKSTEDEDEEQMDEDGSGTGKKQKKRSISREEATRRICAVKGISELVLDYSFDVFRETWCQIVIKSPSHSKKVDFWSLLKALGQKCVISEIPGIVKAFLVDSPTDPNAPPVLTTDGINFAEVFKHNRLLDLNKLRTNHIYSVATMYGIDACASTIARELKSVFGMYGIEVDYRHLSLIASYMTFDGVYRPFNRMGMELSASPIQQISFETPMHFLRNALFRAIEDPLLSPSARLTVGELTKGGTGCVELMTAWRNHVSETDTSKQ
ncbi:unnamed protein product [Cyprideis torosa]|uniref:DNA-directed RNA polymerase subunit n=1 Tax=Cyprideis torosa TaxID=163714 RepID=A0A7R8WKS9_9CRUS|nr:unnamed protein product [Cyprideis torosa]CAG0897253.1 unnamed protein product [Cyprideis torosa]